ncbi:MAG TPA: protein-disulfide reductase DsbD family protein, partial [Bacteroidota bacterium]|nr:protein-disulfide reductase DsbD family protein [Bacteroidota bacterium]
MKKTPFFVSIFAFIILFNINSLFASPKLVDISAYPSRLTVQKDEKFWIKLDININKNYHTYSFKLQEGEYGGPTQSEIHFSPESDIKIAGNLIAPKPYIKYDSAFFMNIECYKGKISVEVPVIAKRNLDFKKDRVIAKAYLQLCTEEGCIPPDFYSGRLIPEVYTSKNTTSQSNIDNSAQVSLVQEEINNPANEPEQKISQNKSGEVITKSQENIQESKKAGIFSFLWVAMTAGALALLTPCVFPMIPITVSFFTKRAESHPGRALRDSTIYALGIILTFTAIGFLLAIIFGATGIRDFASNPWVNTAIG